MSFANELLGVGIDTSRVYRVAAAFLERFVELVNCFWVLERADDCPDTCSSKHWLDSLFTGHGWIIAAALKVDVGVYVVMVRESELPVYFPLPRPPLPFLTCF